MKSIPSYQKSYITELLIQGKSIRAVTEKVRISQSTVARIRASIKGKIPVKCDRRPRKLSKKTVQYSARLASTCKASTAVAIQKTLRENLGVHVHRSTVARNLRHSVLSAFVKCKKPFLKQETQASQTRICETS